MREILFRGKRTDDNNKWVYGYYVEAEKLDGKGTEYFIIEKTVVGSTNRVLPKTVGQYTGSKDINGKKIFEGDIIGIPFSPTWRGVIIWIDEIASFGLYHDPEHKIAWENSNILKRATQGIDDAFTAEVIGNIYDNPELLEEKT